MKVGDVVVPEMSGMFPDFGWHGLHRNSHGVVVEVGPQQVAVNWNPRGEPEIRWYQLNALMKVN